jgi:hypothetical protein
MDWYEDYISIPIGSLLTREVNKDDHYMQELVELPRGIINIILSPKTGAYIRGLVKAHNLRPEMASIISYSTLQICYGEKEIAQLPSILSTELKIPNDTAQQLSQDIEKELFAPVAIELNQYVTKKRQLRQSITSKSRGPVGTQNVLDLKKQQQPPKPPPIPKQ